MAIMIPPIIPDDASESEKIIFETFKHTPIASAREWRVFHRVKTPLHGNTLNPSVIDFVIHIQEYHTVVCFQIAQNDASVDPVREAMSAFKDHFKDFFDADSLLSLGGVSVQARDFDYLIWLMENDSYVTEVVSPDNLVETLENYIYTLYNSEWSEIEEWNNAQEQMKKLQQDLEILVLTNVDSGVPQEQMDKLQQDLELAGMTTNTIYRYDLETSRRELLRLTLDQLNSLQRMGNNDRCLISGAAGTGKTVLAMELAKERCEAGETVALLCSNPNLSQRFEKWAEKLSNENSGQILAGTPASLLSLVFEDNDFLKQNHMDRLQKYSEIETTEGSPESETTKRFSKLETTLRLGSLDNAWEEFISDTIEDLRDGGLCNYFDYLIIDEAQNLCHHVFLKLINELLKSGLVTGRWSMFGDPNQDLVSFDSERGTDTLNESGGQTSRWSRMLNEFGEQTSQWLRELNEGLRRSSKSEFKWWYDDELETNCRNTHEIADAVARLANIKSPPMSGVHGPPIQLKYFENQAQLGHTLDELISTWKKIGYESRQIILLSSVSSDKFDTGRTDYGGWKLMNISGVTEDIPKVDGDPGEILVASSPSQGDILRYSDVYDFQGLESDLAILVMPVTDDMVELSGGVTLPRVDHLNRVLYTGMSRAKTMLIILAHESYTEVLGDRWESYDW